jgi:hypothetical protein
MALPSTAAAATMHIIVAIENDGSFMGRCLTGSRAVYSSWTYEDWPTGEGDSVLVGDSSPVS